MTREHDPTFRVEKDLTPLVIDELRDALLLKGTLYCQQSGALAASQFLPRYGPLLWAIHQTTSPRTL